MSKKFSPKEILIPTLVLLLIGIVAAALLGAWVSTALDVEVLRKPFGVYLLCSGVSLI